MNRRIKHELKTIRDSCKAIEEYCKECYELDEGFPEEVSEEVIPDVDKTNWTTADADTKEGVYLKDLKEMTSLKDVAIVGQIKTVFDLKSYATKEGKKGFVYRLVLQDESDEVVVVAFDDMATKLKQYTIGQYLRITNAWQMKKNKNGKPEVHVGNFAKIEVVE